MKPHLTTPKLTHYKILTLMASLVLRQMPFELSTRPVSMITFYLEVCSTCQASFGTHDFYKFTTLVGRRFQMLALQIERNHLLMLTYACCMNINFCPLLDGKMLFEVKLVTLQLEMLLRILKVSIISPLM